MITLMKWWNLHSARLWYWSFCQFNLPLQFARCICHRCRDAQKSCNDISKSSNLSDPVFRFAPQFFSLSVRWMVILKWNICFSFVHYEFQKLYMDSTAFSKLLNIVNDVFRNYQHRYDHTSFFTRNSNVYVSKGLQVRNALKFRC